jgi:hypothetical protein
MQQGRNAAESAFTWPKQAVARKSARNGGALQRNRAAAAATGGRWDGFRPIEKCVPSAI